MCADLADRIAEVVTEACWRQWRPLLGEGLVLGAGERPALSLIDPEGLVLASLCLRHREQRLRDRLHWWARHGASLLSAQRLQNLAKDLPAARLAGGVAWFASVALETGDRRWKRAADGAAEERARPGKGPAEVSLVEPSTLMLRLRAGFGVGAKADVMTFLVGAHRTLRERELWATARVLAESTGWSRPSVSRAAGELVQARFLEVSGDRPVSYSLDLERWIPALRLREPFGLGGSAVADEDAPSHIPAWRFWHQVLAFLLCCEDWARTADEHRHPAVVRASFARDMLDEWGRFLAFDGLVLPDPVRYRGEALLAPFEALVLSTCDLVEAGL